jgi:Dolichyl-phosphate-mannose-protein mannosyltransferase
MTAPAAAPRTTGPADETVVIRIGPGRDRAAYAIGVIATLLSAAATAYFLHQHMIVGFRDAYAHLEISRRVLVGKTVGIAQLGGIWLPAPHILQALFAWNWTLYRTGLAGSFVSMAAYIASSVLVYRIVKMLTGRRTWPAVAGAAVFMTNPNLLYQQSTPMDELPFYVFTLGAVYALIRWASTKRATYVLAAGICSMIATLCRYESWFLGGLYAICVVIMARRMGLSWRDTRGLGLVAALFGFFVSVSGWLIYNWIIFGSPLNFLYGPNSSADQMASQQTEIEIHNWPLTLRAYATAVTANLGLIELGLAALALVVFFVRERLSAKSLPVIALIMVIPFFLYTLESGQEPIGTPTLNGGLTNFRFGLVVLLPASILIGYLFGSLPRKAVPALSAVAAVAIAGLSGSSFARHQIVLETEAGENQAAQTLPIATGRYLQQHTQGAVLIDMVRNELVGFPVLDRTVYSGTRDARGNVWNRSLKDPERTGIDVIVMRSMPTDEDAVYKALHDTPQLKPYREAYHNADYTVYVLQSAP